jgi:STAS domain/Histidine kinase-like ATPase domain
VRRVTARAGLPAGRAEDFVLAVSEIAANAVRHGSPTARLLLRVAGGAAQAEVRDSGYWRPAAGAASGTGRSGRRGLALARLVCGGVGIRAAAVARDLRIIVDLAALEFIDCCALDALGRVRAQARQADGDLLLAAPRGPVRRILALTGLIDVFSVHASVEDAVRIARPVVTTG